MRPATLPPALSLPLSLLLALAACGGGDREANGVAAPAAEVQAGSDAEIAADAELADEAARAEAEDAAIGGNVTPEDVAAANLQ